MDRGLGNHPEFIAPRSASGDADDVEAIVRMAVQDAVSYVDEELGPDRATATDYYNGKPFGNEVAGRSQVVLTEVRDAIIGVEPSILRLVHGPEHVVEFVPRRSDAVPMAAQATDYVRFVYEEDNQGFLISRAALRDGLLKKIGAVKWGMDTSPVTTTTRYTALTREQLAVLAEPDNTLVSNATIGAGGLVDCEITRTEPANRIWVAPIPPDDLFWNREARSLPDAILVGHRNRLTRGTLLGMGVSEDDLNEYGQPLGQGQETQEEVARRQNAVSGITADPEMGEENRRILYCEIYMRLTVADDERGTPVYGLRRICTLGDSYKVIKNEPADEVPIAAWTPDPEPHALLGQSWYDRLKDMQKINSMLLRSIFDSAAISAFPRVAYVDGQVSAGDILNTAIGAPIRMRQPGMVQSFDQPFTGEKLMPVLSFMQEIIERRVGQRDGAGSLDMDALQSTGKEAVNAAIVAAQAQPELLVRQFAEQLLKPMFRGILRLAALPQSKERIVRLRGQYVPVNPASFDPDMDVAVNVCLGSTNTEKKVAVLRDVVADQSAILAQYGPDNPVVSLAMLRDAKADLLTLQGLKNVEAYYKPVDPNYQPPPPPPAEPTPDELWIQAEKEMAFQKQMKELAIKQDELALKEKQMESDAAFRDRELALREREAEMELMKGPHNAEIEKYKADLAAQTEAARIASNEQMERARLAVEAEKARLEAETKQAELAMRKYEADQTAKTAQAQAAAKPEPKEEKEPKEKDDAEEKQPIVVNIQAPPAPNVTVEPPVVNVAAPERKKGKRKATVKGSDGTSFTVESDD